jgi:hypothetical protein
MNKYLNIIYVLFLLILSCSKEDKNEDVKNTFLDSDNDLIREWIFNDYNPDMNPSMEFTLKDLTTVDMQVKLDARVYAIVSDVPGLGGRGVFVKDSVVYDLGRYNLFGATEPENLLVTDLDSDGNYELFFTLTHGSGILRTNIVCYINDLDDLYLHADGNFFFPLDYSIGLQKNSNHLDIIYKSGSTKLNIGEVTLAKVDDELRCLMKLDDDLPQSVLDDISGND